MINTCNTGRLVINYFIHCISAACSYHTCLSMPIKIHCSRPWHIENSDFTDRKSKTNVHTTVPEVDIRWWNLQLHSSSWGNSLSWFCRDGLPIRSGSERTCKCPCGNTCWGTNSRPTTLNNIGKDVFTSHALWDHEWEKEKIFTLL